MLSKKLCLWMVLLFVFTACEANNTIKSKPPISKYEDFNKWKEGRPCDKITFMCLPESQDKNWQSIPLKDGLDMFELSPEVMAKRKAIIQRWRDEEDGKVKEQSVKLAAISEAFYDRVEAKQFLVKMEQALEKEFPGFWRDVPKKVRYRWIRRAMSKAKKFGYADGEITDNIQVIRLCARIGLDFDLDPKWDYITKFVTHKDRGYLPFAGEACNYIDYTIFKKDKDRVGNRYTDWYFRDILHYLPQPKRKLPRLND